MKLIKTDGATPGKGRNIGIAAAANEWIALTDAGIRLEPDWLERLVRERDSGESVDIVYGDYAGRLTVSLEMCRDRLCVTSTAIAASSSRRVY
ncbi:MAG: glycosyltransferase family 2 protein [Acidobacteria bacterium]|nr:glycosyltransferase family 2 protein [Acidobacteriota bacterium]